MKYRILKHKYGFTIERKIRPFFLIGWMPITEHSNYSGMCDSDIERIVFKTMSEAVFYIKTLKKQNKIVWEEEIK